MRTLAAGESEVVYLAARTGPGRFRKRVVLKVFAPEAKSIAESLAFVRHATVAARLDHPNIMPIHDLLMVNDRPVLVSEWIDGADLGVVLDALPGRMAPVWVVMTIAEQLLDALGYGHEFVDDELQGGLVHGDVSLENVIIGFNGVVKLIDYAVATMRPVGLRSPSPEQRSGGRVDGRSDLYQVGELMRAALGEDAPPAIEQIIERSTRRDPDNRYPDAAAMLEDVQRVARLMTDTTRGALSHWVRSVLADDVPGPELDEAVEATVVDGEDEGEREGTAQTKRVMPHPLVRSSRTRAIPDRFEIVDELGRGGMAVVYHARDRVLGRDVALKLLRDDCSADASVRMRFMREARAAASLEVPAIVTVFDVDPEGRFIVMELIEGETLANRLERNKLPGDEVRRVAAAILGTLDVAHRSGIVHRDIKPANVLFDEDDRVRVTDFGIALFADSELTQTGARVGTPAYMAPEQFRAGAVDERSDVYATGATLFEAATGIRLHGAEGRVSDPRQTVLDATGDNALARAIERSTRDRPAERFATAAEMASAIGISL